MRDGIVGERDGHEVVELAVIAAGAEVLRVKADVVLGHECLDVQHELLVEWRGRADRQRQAVDDERVTLGEPAQLLALCTADMNPVLWRDFHEVDLGRRIRHQLVEQRAPQAEARALHRVLRSLVAHHTPV